MASIGYSPEHHTLEIEFRNGHVYQYFAVPKSTYDALITADSKGTFVNRHIRSAYPFERN